MAKKVSSAVLDGGLDAIATGTEIYVCTAEPADRAAAISTNLIDGNTTESGVSPHTLTSGDFTKAAGTGTNRKITVAQQADLPIYTGGTATHIVICTSTDLLLVTTCTSQPLTAGGTVTIPAFEYESAQPT